MVAPGSPLRRFDMHCHLDFAQGGACRLALAALAAGVGAFSNTVTPAGYEDARAQLADVPNVRVGLGLHPWWVADGSCGAAEVARFGDLAAGARWIGEVGLDFAPRREGTFDAQVEAFECVLDACGSAPNPQARPRLLSVHAVRSAETVLDLLERHGTLRAGNTVILHWFSGTSDELSRAVKLGCFFSVGARMLATKRGRAYARAVPAARILLETDLPDAPDPAARADAWLDDLARAEALLVEATGDEGRAAAAAENSRRLLGL